MLLNFLPFVSFIIYIFIFNNICWIATILITDFFALAKFGWNNLWCIVSFLFAIGIMTCIIDMKLWRMLLLKNRFGWGIMMTLWNYIILRWLIYLILRLISHSDIVFFILLLVSIKLTFLLDFNCIFNLFGFIFLFDELAGVVRWTQFHSFIIVNILLIRPSINFFFLFYIIQICFGMSIFDISLLLHYHLFIVSVRWELV